MQIFEKNILIYKTKEGKEPFVDWLNSLRDKIIRHRIKARLDRVRHGNFGDYKRFHGIVELRLDFGKGYRIYLGEEGNHLIILLVGGDKGTQDEDIKEALKYWQDYQE